MNEHRQLLQTIQPGLLGLVDGSISTLSPLYALAFLVSNPLTVFLAIMATTVGAAISMGVSEGLSDDGELTGRGHPVRRGFVTGTGTLIGGTLHTLPFLVPNMNLAVILATALVLIELVGIAYIRYHYFTDVSILKSLTQVTFSGIIVIVVGLLIGQI